MITWSAVRFHDCRLCLGPVCDKEIIVRHPYSNIGKKFAIEAISQWKQHAPDVCSLCLSELVFSKFRSPNPSLEKFNLWLTQKLAQRAKGPKYGRFRGEYYGQMSDTLSRASKNFRAARQHGR